MKNLEIIIVENEEYRPLNEGVDNKFVRDLGILRSDEDEYYIFCVGDEKFTREEGLEFFKKDVDREYEIPGIEDEDFEKFVG